MHYTAKIHHGRACAQRDVESIEAIGEKAGVE